MSTLTEDRLAELEKMKKCVDMAVVIWSFVSDAARDDRAVLLDMDHVVALIKPFFPAPLVKTRIDLLNNGITNILFEYGYTTCGCWNLAHILDHVLYEKDLSYFD